MAKLPSMLSKKLIGLLGMRLLRGSALCYLFAASPTTAQIVPDNTLPENSIVTPQDNIIQIDGGTRAGNNLFHSFEQFSVPTNNTAAFNNAIEIQNILSRVTGGSISEINGIIQANGTANLFLINPNGIIFGENASLNIGGSFFATSADSVVFANGAEFSATNPNTPPLLTINIPVGLWFRQTPGTIVNRSGTFFIQRDEKTGDKSEIITGGLQVKPQQTLGLIGGNIILDGGILTTKQGRVELGSVGENSVVGLIQVDNRFELNYQNVPNFRDIQMRYGALVDVRGKGGGDVQVQGRRVTLSQGSKIDGSTLGGQPGGTLAITAQESIDIITSQIRANVGSDDQTQARGDGGNVLLNTQRLSLRQGGVVSMTSKGIGNGGDLIIEATDVEVIGRDFTDPKDIDNSGLFSGVSGPGTGDPNDRNGGNIIITTERLSVRAEQILDKDTANPPEISASLFGTGNAGDIYIQASDSVEVINGAIRADVGRGDDDIGQGGDVTIETGRLLVTEGSFVSSTTLGQGNTGNLTITATDIEVSNPSHVQRGGILSQVNIQGTGDAGNLTINTERLTVRDGEFISVSTENEGDAGTLTINATEVELIGRSSDTSRPEDLAASELLVGLPLINEQVESSDREGGNLDLNTEQLIIRDGAQISGLTVGGGDGGNLNITSSAIELQNGGRITGRAGEPLMSGNISRGGNIEINTDFLMIRDNSNITANAEQGRGGNIDIGVEFIFRDNSSQITASSELGIDGTITLNTPAIDPSSGLIEVPETPIDVATLIGQDACSQTQDSELVNTGTGGVPPSPQESLRSEEILVGLIELNSEVESPHSTPTSKGRLNPATPSNPPVSSLDIVPAMGWIRDQNGDVILVSYDPTQTGVQRRRQHSSQCQP